MGVGKVLDIGVIPTGEDAAAQPLALSQTVDPGDRIPVVLILGRHQLHHCVQIRAAIGVLADTRGGDREHPKRRAGDHARQAHSPKRGLEQVGVLRGSDRDYVATCQHHLERQHVVPDGTVAVVVLSVDVVGDGAADSDVPRSGRHGKEPAPWNARAKDPINGLPRHHGHRAGLRIQPDQAPHGGHVQDGPAGVLGHVAVTATHPARQNPARSGLSQCLRQRLSRARARDARTRIGRAAPPCEQTRLRRGDGHR